jgi:hypothetical protein
MIRFTCVRFVALWLSAWAMVPALALAQTRTTGQIVGTVKDATGAVVQGAQLVLIDLGTGRTVEAKSGSDGGFVFPNLQPGTYQLAATREGFQPITLQSIIVETSRSTDVTVRFEVLGVTEKVEVSGSAPAIETTSTTVANTVRNAEIAKLPLAGRNILNFALLVPGAATSAGARDSEYNGLPGGAINITLDGINNNSQRFRSGGTSFFVFAPIRLGAIEEVTVSTAGLTSEAGAEGAVQVQFATKRGTNRFRGQAFDTIQNEALNAQSFVNKARGLPKTKLRQHEYGANIGGPVLRNKLFFFANFEHAYSPSETVQTRTLLTPEAQQGILRYTASDGTVRTINLLDLAASNGLPSTVDPYIAGLFQMANATVGQGDLVPAQTALHQNTLRFIIKDSPDINVYPSARVDYQASPSLAVRGILNLHYRDLPRNPPFPGLDPINGGFKSTYYIWSGGVDWTPRPNLFNTVTGGVQSNFEEFNPGNRVSPSQLYNGPFGFQVTLPLGISSPVATGNPGILSNPRNNPVYNISDTLTWLKGNHTWTFGGTFRRTSDYDKGEIAPPSLTLGLGTGDPALNVISTANIPGLRSNDLATAQNLYALLVGRVSGVGGASLNLNPETGQYEAVRVPRNEAQNVGGLFAQDQWRISPQLTMNYGLRWELTGAVYNPSGVYSGPTVADLYGPSTAPFQPGVLDGVADPQVYLRPKPYKGDFNNPAPNVGLAWNPDKPQGILGALLGKAVYRGNFGISYYDEGLIAFETAAGNGPGATQTLALPPFTPGSLNLQTPPPAFTRTPASFSFPVPMSGLTFTRGFTTYSDDIKSPMILNWSVGYQRELWRNAALEIRYVGNRGKNIWRSYDLNETNIIENGFVDEFRNAQRNLQINLANQRSGFANNSLPGQVPLPIFETAFGARGSQPALGSGASFTNANFITQLQEGEAGALANSLAGSGGQNFQYLCRLVGNKLPACASRGYNAPGPYPINLFQTNPFAAGNSVRLLTDEAETKYDSLQLQFRQRPMSGLTLTTNYTYAKARTDRYDINTTTVLDYRTMRNKELDWGPTAYDLRHVFQTYGTYELPFGRNRRFSFDNSILDQILGGWSTSAIIKLQTGRPFLLESGRNTLNQEDAGVILNGITVEELQKMIEVSPGTNGFVYFFDRQLIGPDGRANPDFIGFPTEPGQQGQYVYLHGPGLMTVDFGLSKTFRAGGDRTFSFEALFINAFNHRNTIVGNTNGATLSIDSTTFGQTTSTALGSRDIQFRLVFSY